MLKLRSIIFLPLLLAATSAPTTQPDPLEHQRKEEQEKLNRQYDSCPFIGKSDIESIAQLSLKNGNLVLQTTHEPTTEMSRVLVPGPTGPCLLNLRRSDAPASPSTQPYVPDVLMLQRYDTQNPEAVIDCITIQVSALNLQFSRDMETNDVVTQVSYVQSWYPSEPTFGTPAESPVRLRVTLPGKDGGTGTTISRDEKDFATLRQKYPEDCEKYLLPIFRALHAEALFFAPTRDLAMQVFASDEKPDPAIEAKVRELVSKLNAQDFRTRKSATNELTALGPPAAVVLMHLDRSGMSLEQSTRIDAIIGSYQPGDSQRASQLRNDPRFLLNCLYLNDPFITPKALERLQQVVGKPIQFDPNQSSDTRYEALQQLRESILGSAESTTNPTTTPAN